MYTFALGGIVVINTVASLLSTVGVFLVIGGTALAVSTLASTGGFSSFCGLGFICLATSGVFILAGFSLGLAMTGSVFFTGSGFLTGFFGFGFATGAGFFAGFFGFATGSGFFAGLTTH